MEAGRRQQIQRWMVAFADGDRSAFEPLFHALWPTLLAFTTGALASEADGEDAAQLAIMKVFSRIAEFDRSRDGVSWVLGIAGYEAMTIRRQRLRRKETAAVDLQKVQHPEQDIEERTMAEQLRLAVMAVVGELPKRDRDALAYAFAGEQPPTDERSRKRRFRALERLRAAWRRVHG